MKLIEIFSQLSQGELSQLSIKGAPQGVINSNNQEMIINAINLGLANLHTRFNLREGNMKLILLPDMYQYQLKSDFVIDNPKSTQAVRYIETDFKDDLAKVERVVTEDGVDLPLNTKSKYACSTPSTHVLKMPVYVVDQDINLPTEFLTNAVDIVYRAMHPKITEEYLYDIDAEEYEIELPYPYLEPLLYFVAGRVHHPIGLSGDFNMGASYAAKFEQACQRLESQNLQIDKGQENTRLERNGWV
jgi:hypothetical protein